MTRITSYISSKYPPLLATLALFILDGFDFFFLILPVFYNLVKYKFGFCGLSREQSSFTFPVKSLET